MKKLLNVFVLIILLVGFGFGCFYIFGNEKEITTKIVKVQEEKIVLEDNKELNINKDTIYTLLGDKIDYKYFNDNYLRYNAKITVRNDYVLKINLQSDKIYLLAYFYDGASEDNKGMIKDTVSIINHVLKVDYVSKEDAKEEMTSKSDVFKDLFERMEENPLKSYLLIEVDGNINQIVEYLNNLDEIERVVY